MSEVYFYHLTQSTVTQTLTQLLGKCLGNNWRVLLRGGDAALLSRLDLQLWGGNSAQFLPHGLESAPHGADQPVLLTDKMDNTNNAEALMLVHGAKTSPQDVAGFTRVCLIFDGNDPDSLNQARGDWKNLTDAGIKAKYWSQETGQWAMKVEKN